MERNIFDATHGIRNDGQIYLGALNLEGMTDSELECALSHPALHMDVRAYARTLLLAREARSEGLIVAAQRLESKLDARYAVLPASVRW